MVYYGDDFLSGEEIVICDGPGVKRCHQSSDAMVFKNELTDVKTMSFKLKHFEKEKLELEKKCKDIFQLLINEKALSFTETFGLKPIKVDCKSESGLNVSFKLGENIAPKYSYEKIESEYKEALKQILFLLDKICISDAAFHELSMLVDDMPRTYLNVQCRDDINKIYHIERLPGNKPGAMINLNSEIERMLKYQISKDPTANKFQIKFSGDGARSFSGQQMKYVFLSSQNKNKYGVKHKPLLNIEVDHFLPDELHLMLRITDVLLRNVIFDVLDKDDKAKKQGLPSTNLEDFVTLVQSCGVSFHVWTPKGSTEIEWSSLTGLDKIKVLKSLPEKLLESDTVNTDIKKDVVKLWTDFYCVYKFVNSDDSVNFSGEEIFEKIKLWMLDFLSLENIGRSKRHYNKQSDWWEKEIYETRNEKRKKILCEIKDADNVRQSSAIDLGNLSDCELRDMVSSLQGRKTRVKSWQKLLALIKELQ
ncbi:unnamed protein product [Mytilus edulis]|uniref:Uncharacterized protein n=1 Tax=Mytilus edulis TaxID=6550 RepID=A0A8S3S5J3_MYTED|nr:unnamed protein product [Mytilus edulis]